MEPSTRLKGVCKKFIGTFPPSEWEKVVEHSRTLKNSQVKNIQTARKRMLTITCKSGVLNLLTSPFDHSISGNLILHGKSVEEITQLPLWKFFEDFASSSNTNALIHFYPKNGVQLEFKNGILQFKKNQIDNDWFNYQLSKFRKEIWINHLLEKLSVAIEGKNESQILHLKKELSRL